MLHVCARGTPPANRGWTLLSSCWCLHTKKEQEGQVKAQPAYVDTDEI
jgi:hypothetical protein